MSPAYFAPPDDPGLPPRAAHLPPDAFLAGSDQPIEVTVSDDDADAALWYLADRGWQRTALRDDGPYRRAGTLPVAALTGKVARYAVTFGGRTFPEDRPGTPEQLGQPAAPITVFDAAQLRPEGLPAPHGTASQLTLAEGALRFTCDGFPTTGSDAAGVRLGARPATCEQPVVLVRARATEESTTSFELGLVLEDGRAYGYDVPIGLEWATVRVPADQLRPLWSTKGGRFESDRLREVSLVFGTWLYGAASAQAHGFELASVSVEPGLPGWAVPVEPIGPPVPLLRPAAAARLRLNTGGARSRLIGVPGEEVAPGVEFSHPASARAASFGIEWSVAEHRGPAGGDGRLHEAALEPRGGTPATTKMEVVLVESDASAWGTIVDLSPTWQTIEVALRDLRFFGHWRKVAGRGEEGDHCRAGQVSRVHLTIGAWLNPDHAAEPWRLQLADVELVP